MKKLVEITKPAQCIHREVAFTSRNIVSGEIDGQLRVEGYDCKHPNCTKKFLKSVNKDFLPCNDKDKFPRLCPLNEPKPTIVDVVRSIPNVTMSDDVAERIAKTMDIRAKRGTAVRLQMKDGEVFGGYDGDKKQALQFLKPDVIYHVKRTEVEDWNTDVYLEEVPDQGFNSVMFEHVKE